MATVTKPIVLNETFGEKMNELISLFAGIAKGAVPLYDIKQASGAVEIIPNVTNVFPELTGSLTVSFAAASEELDCEWIFIIPMGSTAQSVILPEIDWYLGIAPTFEANSVTEVRVHAAGGALRGVWSA